jgi:hypothetical protein
MASFAADCAERVLAPFERRRPGDARPREAVEAARSLLAGGGSIEAARDARERTVFAAHAKPSIPGCYLAACAACYAVDAALAATLDAASRSVAESADCSAKALAVWDGMRYGNGDSAFEAVYLCRLYEERDWQMRRLAALRSPGRAPAPGG